MFLMIYQPDEPFALSVSDETDKSSEDPDVVLQTLKKFFESLSSVFFLPVLPLRGLLCQRSHPPKELLPKTAQGS